MTEKQYLTNVSDFAEVQAERQIPMKMQDWIERLDAFWM